MTYGWVKVKRCDVTLLPAACLQNESAYKMYAACGTDASELPRLITKAPFTQYNLLSTGCQTGLTTGCIVYKNIQPVVKPV